MKIDLKEIEKTQSILTLPREQNLTFLDRSGQQEFVHPCANIGQLTLVSYTRWVCFLLFYFYLASE